jgi:protein-disulfide isomerase
VVTNYVKTGNLRLTLRLQTFLGPDSAKAARAIVAAGFQDKAWPYLEVFYANQGPENSGYVTDDFLRRVGEQVDGLDVARVLADRKDPRVKRILKADAARFNQFNLDSTPAFVLDDGSGHPRQIDGNLEPGPFTRTLDAALAGR